MQALPFQSDSIENLYRCDEESVVENLLQQIEMDPALAHRIQNLASEFIDHVRSHHIKKLPLVEQFLTKYPLHSPQGTLFMELAESLLRIPDPLLGSTLLDEKLRNLPIDLAQSSSRHWIDVILKIVTNVFSEQSSWKKKITLSLLKAGSPAIRSTAILAIRFLARHFVAGETIEKGLKKAISSQKFGYSFDMLGEAALTRADSDRYFNSYMHALTHIASSPFSPGDFRRPTLSIKLSALHPRYEFSQSDHALPEISEKVLALALAAQNANISLTLDAEEADRLSMSLKIFETVFFDSRLKEWDGLGLAVQAYQKRAPAVIDHLATLADQKKCRIKVRLVKGAYWDSEIKWTQEKGLKDYPVFTRKASTDLSYLVCAQKMLNQPQYFYPQFATHNAYTVASILSLANFTQEFEFQRLYGMGQALYESVFALYPRPIPCRIYAPIGPFKDLLPYLVRRLLENGANSSFVNQLTDPSIPIETLIKNPIQEVRSAKSIRHPHIKIPREIYSPSRLNAKSLDLTSLQECRSLLEKLEKPIYLETSQKGKKIKIQAPFDRTVTVGEISIATQHHIDQALQNAEAAWSHWNQTPAAERAQCLYRLADLLEEHHMELMNLCIYEAGKTIPDSNAEIREAVDFCRYYATQGLKDFSSPFPLPGPTGELNTLKLEGRGIFVCISPWNFPLAIFLGQVSAALMAGNTVLAKPAEQTPLIAAYAVQLCHQAGVPMHAIQLIVGDGTVGESLVSDRRTKGIAFTGSMTTAKIIAQNLAHRPGEIIPLLAETGGQNCMIVDATALPEQVVRDVISSAFQSAGQRCSALRALLVQEEIEQNLIAMLKGAMAELRLGNPCFLATDIGPVIDQDAYEKINTYCILNQHRLIYQTPTEPKDLKKGTFCPPTLLKIDHIDSLQEEIFGPVLHIISYKFHELPSLLEKINQLGYGLTGGVHSRLHSTIELVKTQLNVGNVYVNRNIIGAVVGVHPFGGRGLSGTGPKAGGPFYLHRFAHEKVISNNLTIQGGNTHLLSLSEEDTKSCSQI